MTIPFDFEGAAVRVVKIDGEPWFVAVDVCRALGYNQRSDGTINTSQALKTLSQKEVTAYPIGGFRGVPAKLISEAGLYRLVMRSDKPAARRFQDWVTGTVLPAIRKDGAYIMGEEKVASGELEETQAGSTAARNSWRSTPAAASTRPGTSETAGPPFPGRRHPPSTPSTEATTSTSPAPPARRRARARITHRARPPAADAIQGQQAGSTAARNSWRERHDGRGINPEQTRQAPAPFPGWRKRTHQHARTRTATTYAANPKAHRHGRQAEGREGERGVQPRKAEPRRLKEHGRCPHPPRGCPL